MATKEVVHVMTAPDRQLSSRDIKLWMIFFFLLLSIFRLTVTIQPVN